MSKVSQRNQGTKENRSELARKAMIQRSTKSNLYNEYGYQIVIGGFIATCVLATFMTLNFKKIDIKTTSVIDSAEIAQWNEEAERYGYTFRNGENDYFDGWLLIDAKYTLNNILYKDGQTNRMQLCKAGEEESTIIPDNYNFREEMEECAAPIQNQGNCSSNYALVGTSTIADRFCSQSKFHVRPDLNSQTYTSCDNKQRNKDCGQGGVQVSFLEYVRNKGLLDEQCFEYDNNDWERECPDTTECEPYKIYDFCVLQKEENMKREIMTNGPVITASKVFVDMLTYKSGVYQNVDGRTAKFGNKFQQFKIVGWGQDDETETPYWLAENTWGDSWGEEGLIRIEINNEKSTFGYIAFAPRPRIEQEDEYVEDEDLEEFEEDDEIDLDDEESDE